MLTDIIFRKLELFKHNKIEILFKQYLCLVIIEVIENWKNIIGI